MVLERAVLESKINKSFKRFIVKTHSKLCFLIVDKVEVQKTACTCGLGLIKHKLTNKTPLSLCTVCAKSPLTDLSTVTRDNGTDGRDRPPGVLLIRVIATGKRERQSTKSGALIMSQGRK